MWVRVYTQSGEVVYQWVGLGAKKRCPRGFDWDPVGFYCRQTSGGGTRPITMRGATPCRQRQHPIVQMDPSTTAPLSGVSISQANNDAALPFCDELNENLFDKGIQWVKDNPVLALVGVFVAYKIFVD